MKQIVTLQKVKVFTALVIALFTLAPHSGEANVCGEGLAVPPFLSAGTDPNLLLILDNSGSMLDLAYVENVDECVDDSYDPNLQYAGLFEPTAIYWWKEGVSPWRSGQVYAIGDYVYTDGVFYKATTAGTSTGVEIDEDVNIAWAKVYEISKWVNGTNYAPGSFVQSEEQLYYTVAGGVANDPDLTDGLSIHGDTVNWTPVEHTWMNSEPYSIDDIVSYKGMLFRASSAGTSNGTSVHDDTGVTWVRLNEGYYEMVTPANVADVIDAQENISLEPAYTSSGVYLEIESVGGEQSTVTFFMAMGNFLNWLSASKFDIQKKILTGGKYDEDEQLLISQSRGCSSRGFIKEMTMTAMSDGVTTSVLTFSIEGPDPEDLVDSSDFTTRISILGLTTDGFANSARAQACKTAIDEIAKGEDGSLGTISTNIDVCLDYSGANNVLAESNAAYNHSVFTCWKIVKSGYTVPSDLGNVSEVVNGCEGIYAEVQPPSINTEDSGYPCYGVYNAAIPDAKLPTGNGSDREGYIGRCWEPGSEPAGYDFVPCTVGQPYGTGNPRCYPGDLQYCCSGNYNGVQDTCNKPWILLLEDEGTGAIVCDDTIPAAVGAWTDDNNPNTAEGCIQEAMWDYCQSLGVPEVVDPSDLIFNTTETWGLVGALVDSGVMNMFGVDRTLIVMKGHIKKTTQPEGVLHRVANDLRIGAMAFNQNGADTECAAADPTDNIVEYCPAVNKDGAELIAPIRSGMHVTDDKGTLITSDDVRHIDDLTEAINDVEATAWTPLAEAVYNAIGYYGQNTNYRLSADDFLTEAEGGPEDPIQYWCQENNILIITEGASTADVHPDVNNFVTNIMPSLGVEDSTTAVADETECLDADGNNLLFGSTYLDDVIHFAHQGPVAAVYDTPVANPGQILSDDGVLQNKQNINTYIVSTGTLRDDGTTSECNPLTMMTNAASNGGTTLLTGENPIQLESNLQAALSEILSRVSAGSAASVISSTRSGAGAVYQAIFWPDLTDSGGGTISWVGDVHALFLDTLGQLYEDTPVAGIQDRKLDTSVDKRVLFFFDQSVDPARTRTCYGALDTPEDVNNNGVLDTEDVNCNGILDAGEDTNGNGLVDTEDTNNNCVLDIACVGTVTEIDSVNYIWSASAPNANGWLTDNTLDPITQRSPYITNDMERYIFTWNDLDNDGIVDAGEQVDFTYPALSAMTSVATRAAVMKDFAVADAAEWQKVVNWIRGEDQADMRSRLFDGNTWRLGDVIHSTPTLVGKPVEAYHFVYQDTTYARFAKRYTNRRNVVYFGANDGMLHAINAGFYVQKESKFCLTDQRDADGNCDTTDEGSKPLLGAELWGYVPYNLQPHLKCLTSPDYNHKYYVDQRPRVFDVQIFEDDCDYTGPVPDCSAATHPGGWGTILVGSMRFGGAPIQAYISADPAVDDLTDVATDNRKFISSYFILDITDPENPPSLLAEMTMTTDVDGGGNPVYADLGYSTVSPAMSVMRDENGITHWYLVFGNGPTTVKAENSEQGKVAVLPLSWVNGDVSNWDDPGSGAHRLLAVDSTSRKAFRIPNMQPDEDPNNDMNTSDAVEGGVFLIPAAVSGDIESFTSDMVSVDFDIENPAFAGVGAAYKTDAVYFGTTDGSGFSSGFSGCTGIKCWEGGGRLYRLVTKEYDLGNNEIVSEPWDWSLVKMIDAQQPINAPPTVGWDNYNFWIYAGTGRFYDRNDKPDDQQHRMFGLIEPMNCNRQQTWPTINWWVAATNKAPDPVQNAGDRGVMRVDQILVELDTGYLFCQDGTINCRKDHNNNEIATFSALRNYIAGEQGCLQADTDIGLDGWFREFPDARERNLGQATLLGGLLTYTTYKPFQDVCKAEGESYLYGVHYQTGTSWKKSVFGTYDFMGSTIVRDRLSLGTGLALTPSLHVGTGDADATAFVQTSTGEILEIAQEELPLGNFKSGRSSWREE